MRNANLIRCLLAAVVLTGSVAGCAAISGRETPREYVDDATISTKVRTTIVSELGLKQIGVETMQNVVQLSGFVDSPLIKSRAGDIARDVAGVQSVRNDLVVR